MQSRDLDVGRIVSQEQDRSIVLIIWIEDLRARKAVPPSLTISIDDA